MHLLDGYKSYLAAGGFFLLALYELVTGNVTQAVQYALAGLSVLGIRNAVQKLETK